MVLLILYQICLYRILPLCFFFLWLYLLIFSFTSPYLLVDVIIVLVLVVFLSHTGVIRESRFSLLRSCRTGFRYFLASKYFFFHSTIPFDRRQYLLEIIFGFTVGLWGCACLFMLCSYEGVLIYTRVRCQVPCLFFLFFFPVELPILLHCIGFFFRSLCLYSPVIAYFWPIIVLYEQGVVKNQISFSLSLSPIISWLSR